MNWHNRPATVGVLHEMVAAANTRYGKTRTPQRCHHLASAQSRQARHKSDGDTLHANKLGGGWRITFNFQTQLDGLSHSFNQLVKGTRLRMATAQFWNAGHVITVLVPFDDDAELALLRFLHGVDIPENGRARKAA